MGKMSRRVGHLGISSDESYRAFEAKTFKKLKVAQISAESSKWRRHARALTIIVGWAWHYPEPISQQESPQTCEVLEIRHRANTESRNRESTQSNKRSETRELTTIATKLEFDEVTYREKSRGILFKQVTLRFPWLPWQQAPTHQTVTK